MRTSACLCLLVCALAGVAIAGCGDDERSAEERAALDAKVAAEIAAANRARDRQRAATPPGASAGSAPAEPASGATAPAEPASAATAPAEPQASEALPSSASDGAEPPRARRTPARRRVSRALLTAADRASFARLAAQLPGEEGVAVTTLGRGRAVARAGTLRAGVAWSTAKVPVAMAAISAGVAQRQDLVQAITASDNAAAERLWSALGAGRTAASAATAQVREAGDSHTQIQSQRLRAGYTAFGQTRWALTDQARFVGGMACTGAGGDVLALMGQVVSGQRWGLGSTGKRAQFKAGWGPGVTPGTGDGWLDRQMGIVRIGGRPVAVAMATTASEHGAGTQSLTAIARWVVSHVNAKRAPRSAMC